MWLPVVNRPSSVFFASQTAFPSDLDSHSFSHDQVTNREVASFFNVNTDLRGLFDGWLIRSPDHVT